MGHFFSGHPVKTTKALNLDIPKILSKKSLHLNYFYKDTVLTTYDMLFVWVMPGVKVPLMLHRRTLSIQTQSKSQEILEDWKINTFKWKSFKF